MGNTMTALYPQQRTLRVYCDQGRLLQFTTSVPAVKLMRDHPSHLLVSGDVKPKQSRFGEARRPKDHVRIRVVRPGDVLQVGQSYFMVHIPEQYTSRFAKYFYPQNPSASPRSNYSPCPSPRSVVESGSASPLIMFDSPPVSPRRAYGRTTSSPLSMYIPSPLSGSIRERMRHPNQQPLRNSTNSSRIQSPGRPNTPRGTTTIRDLMRSDIDDPKFQGNSTDSKGIQRPGRPSAHTEQVRRGTLGQHFQQNPADLDRNEGPARPSMPIAQGRIRKDLSQNFRQSTDRIQSPRRPGTPTGHDTMRRALSQHYQPNPSRLIQSPGRPIMPSHDMTRTFNQQKGSSTYHSKRSPQRSPRRPIKSCQGKHGSRPRRIGMRSPHHKAALLRSPGRLGSPGRIVTRPIAVSDTVCVPCFPLFERETTKKLKSGRAAAGPSINFSAGNVRQPLLMRRGSLSRSAHWTPALESISEH